MATPTTRRSLLDTMRPERTAVIVVDMTNDFLSEGGALARPAGLAICEPIQQLVDAAHDAGSRVVWLRDEHVEEDPEFRIHPVHCLKGTWGTQIVDALTPEAQDLILTKHTYSGFFRTPLHERLQNMGITSIIVTGVATNVCVRSTVHDAFFLGYDVLVPVECVSTASERVQEVTLEDIDRSFGEVVTLERVLEALETSTKR